MVPQITVRIFPHNWQAYSLVNLEIVQASCINMASKESVSDRVLAGKTKEVPCGVSHLITQVVQVVVKLTIVSLKLQDTDSFKGHTYSYITKIYTLRQINESKLYY